MSEEESILKMIVVMGVTGAGKSYFINKLAGYTGSKEGSSLDPCTLGCQAVPANLGGSKVLLIDTPGFDDSERSDTDILKEISRILTFQYEQGVKLQGAIYLHRITDVRYARTNVRTLKIFEKICGEDALHNVLLVSTRWNEVDESLGAQREKQLRVKFWQYMLARGSSMERFHGSMESARVLASMLMTKPSTVLELQRELVDERKPLGRTAAGALVSEDLEELKKQHEEDMAEIIKLQQSLQDNDRKMQEAAEKDWWIQQQKLQQDAEDEQRLRADIAAEVRAEIEAEKKNKKKRGVLRSMLPFIPSVMSLLGLFVGIPPGTFEMFTSWLGDSGIGSSFTEFFDSF